MKGIKMIVDNTEFIKKLINRKMLTVKAEENVVRLFPPLTVDNAVPSRKSWSNPSFSSF